MLRTVTGSAWTEEDRALMLGYRAYLDTLCSGECGQPRELAHHWDNDGWYDTEATVCHACTALKQAGSSEPVEPVEYLTVLHPRDYEKKPLREAPKKRPGRGARR